MNRAQLHHAIRTACTIPEQDSVVIIGSQAISGNFDEDELPLESTMSNEIDTLPCGESHEEIVMLADRLEGVAGEWSDFDIEHGFHIDGVDAATAILPDGWRDRLVPISAESTVNIITGQQYTGLCLEPHDLCAATLCAGREKDHQFVRASSAAGWLMSHDRVPPRRGTRGALGSEGRGRELASVLALRARPLTRTRPWAPFHR